MRFLPRGRRPLCPLPGHSSAVPHSGGCSCLLWAANAAWGQPAPSMVARFDVSSPESGFCVFKVTLPEQGAGRRAAAPRSPRLTLWSVVGDSPALAASTRPGRGGGAVAPVFRARTCGRAARRRPWGAQLVHGGRVCEREQGLEQGVQKGRGRGQPAPSGAQQEVAGGAALRRAQSGWRPCDVCGLQMRTSVRSRGE